MPDNSDHRQRAAATKMARSQKKILDAALRIAGREHLCFISTQEVAEEAGVSVPTIYKYYESIGELLNEVHDLIFTQYCEKIEAIRVEVAESESIRSHIYHLILAVIRVYNFPSPAYPVITKGNPVPKSVGALEPQLVYNFDFLWAIQPELKDILIKFYDSDNFDVDFFATYHGAAITTAYGQTRWSNGLSDEECATLLTEQVLLGLSEAPTRSCPSVGLEQP